MSKDERPEGPRITPVRRALVSVYDKQGVVDLARALVDMKVELLSTGGTGRLLRDEGVPMTRVSEITGVQEMLDGRVKTLHPMVHAGVLAVRDNAKHRRDMESYGAGYIDLVVVNLYPFEKTARMEGIGLPEIVEMIDIGGPTMVRAAAKNFHDVGVVVDPSDYERVVDEIREFGGLTDATRLVLARKAFGHTASYDTAIFSFLSQIAEDGSRKAPDSLFPQKLSIAIEKIADLRYGENPHQRAALYGELQGNEPTITRAVQLQGVELSFNNYLDLDAAVDVAMSAGGCGVAIIKHNNPSGVAVAERPVDAFRIARECDPESAFGGVVAFNQPVDEEAAEELAGMFLEAVIAPSFTPDAKEVLARKKKLRVLQWGDPRMYRKPGLDLRRVSGGFLVQEWDSSIDWSDVPVVTKRRPTDAEWAAMKFGWRVVRHVKSNAIVYALADRTVGIGAGQMSRVESVRIANRRAGEHAKGCAMASDAFFPFSDNIELAAQAGITAVIQPGGSIRDEEVIAAADALGLAMVFTKRRHFRH